MKNYKNEKLWAIGYTLKVFSIAVGISFICLLLLQSCSQDDDPFQDNLVYIYAVDTNKEQYEWDMPEYNFLYLAHSADRSCEVYADWVIFNYTSNGPLSYEDFLIYYFTPPFANGYGSKPDMLVYSNQIYDIDADSGSITCQNNLDEDLVVIPLANLVNNEDFITNLN